MAQKKSRPRSGSRKKTPRSKTAKAAAKKRTGTKAGRGRMAASGGRSARKKTSGKPRLCTRCAARRPVKGKSLCRSCASRALESRLEWIESRLAVGGCIDCLRKAKKGSRRCGHHERANREYQRRYDEKRRRSA